jgi:hypothetical protein
MPVLGSVVDGKKLLEVVWTSLLAGIGVTVIFAIATLGVTRAVEFARNGRAAVGAVYGVFGVLALAAVAAAVVFGIVVMTQK